MSCKSTVSASQKITPTSSSWTCTKGFQKHSLWQKKTEKLEATLCVASKLGYLILVWADLIRKGHVVSIAVLPQNRRKGMASALIKKALEGMVYYKAKQCFLEVRVTNESGISLYKKLGFEITRTVNGYYSDGEDAYVMTKRL